MELAPRDPAAAPIRSALGVPEVPVPSFAVAASEVLDEQLHRFAPHEGPSKRRDAQLPVSGFARYLFQEPVSYTHLRAHETSAHL
eukprot:1528174-Alexandrium_andersonii.AAC.1